jgi:hypothetical protein
LERLFEPFLAFRDSATRTARVALFVFESLDFGQRICYLFGDAVMVSEFF